MYEIDRENNLNLIIDFPLSKYAYAEVSDDYLVVTSFDDRTEYMYVITLYDISDMDNIIVVGELFTDDKKFTIKDNHLAISQYDIQNETTNLEIYNIDTLELINTVSNCAIIQSIYDTDKFVVHDIYENLAKVVYINEENNLVTLGELNSGGRVIVHSDRLLVVKDSSVDFYDYGESLEYLSSYTFAEAIALYNQGIFYNGEVLGFLAMTEIAPYQKYIALYNIIDLDNIYKIEDIQLAEFDNWYWMFSTDTITFNDSFLHCYNGYGLVQYNYTNNLLTQEVLQLSCERTYIERSFLKNGIYYDNYFRVSGFNNQLDLSDLTSIQSIADPDTLGNIFFFGDDYQHKIIKNYENKSFDIYTENNEHSFEFVDSYLMSNSSEYFRFMYVLDWNGEDLFYSYGGQLTHVRYQNSSFSVISVNNNVPDEVLWAKYNSYVYRVSSTFIVVYELVNHNLQLVNTIMYSDGISTPHECGISDGILTIESIANGVRAYDLSLDPIELSSELHLDLLFATSSVKRYNDYLIYGGSNNNIDSTGLKTNPKYLNFFKKINDSYVYLGEYFCNVYVENIDIIPGDNDDFTLIASTPLGIKIFSCVITSNNTLDVTPIVSNCYNYPNPFNPETTISYNITKRSHVTVEIFNIKGQKVKSLLKENQEAGQHKIIWKGDNNEGKRVSSGTYLYKVKIGDKEILNKMMLIK